MIPVGKYLFKVSNERNKKLIARHGFSVRVKEWFLSLSKVIQKHWNSTGQQAFFWTGFFWE